MTRLRLVLVSAISGALLALLAVGTVSVWRARRPHEPGLPVLGQAPHYQLINQNGKEISSQDFEGKVQIVTALFPYCRELCPLVAANLAEFDNSVVQQSDLKGRVAFVFFNVAPDDAGPAALHAFDAEDAGTGIRVANALADRVKPNFDVVHADTIEVVDGTGRVRKIFADCSRVDDQSLSSAIVSLMAGGAAGRPQSE